MGRFSDAVFALILMAGMDAMINNDHRDYYDWSELLRYSYDDSMIIWIILYDLYDSHDDYDSNCYDSEFLLLLFLLLPLPP